jgi:hypothetical protein
MMSKLLTSLALSTALSLGTLAEAGAAPVQIGPELPSLTIQVAGGCGPGAWRGPWGHCRNTPFYGRLPNGYYQPEPATFNGCPDGYWRGPWGHCRNTEYHGRLPNGNWQ